MPSTRVTSGTVEFFVFTIVTILTELMMKTPPPMTIMQMKAIRYITGLLVAIALWVGQAMPVAAQDPGNLEELASIAVTRELALEAVNTRDFSTIAPYLHPTFTITTVDNQVFHSAEEFETYWNSQFSNTIESISMTLDVDPDRVFLSPETEIAYGSASSTFDFKSGHQEKMPMRWTAVMQKVGNVWMIQSVHFSANLLENPVLNTAQRLGRWFAIGASVVGVLVGAIASWLIRRLRHSE
jgi:ketosteroid isomerase-like protein